MNSRIAAARNYRFTLRLRSRGARAQDPQWQLAAGAAADPRAHRRTGVFAASDGAAIPYRLWLSGAPRAAVLLLHGAFDYSAAFDEVGPRLARQGFAALAIDQRGFGATVTRGQWAGVGRMSDDVAEVAQFFLDRIREHVPLFILGESMGGAVAVHAAAQGDIHRLAGLVLAAPGALASGFRRRLLAWLAWLARALVGDAELVFERLSGWELTPAAAIRLIGDPLVMRRIRPEILCGMAELAQSAVEEARKVKTPVLTMVGARDELLRQVCIRRLFDNLAGEKEWLVVAGAPHLLLHWRRSGEIVRAAARWIEWRRRGPERGDEQRRKRLVVGGDRCSAGAGVD